MRSDNLLQFIRKSQLFGLMVLSMVLALLPANPLYAGNDFVGDGFGGRAWYVPSTLEIGYENGAYIDADGQLYMWGNTDDTQPLIDPVPGFSSPRAYGWTCAYPVENFDDVKLISLGGLRLGALVNNDGTAYIWGKDSSNPATYNSLQQVLTNVSHVDTGQIHIAFVKADGTVWSVGRNDFGAFGNGTTNTTFTTTPVQMTGMTNAVRVATFGYYVMGNIGNYSGAGTVVLKNDGTVWVAGAPAALTSNNPNNSVTQVNLSNVVDIEGGFYHAAALTASGDVYTWGGDYRSTLGLGNNPGQNLQITSPTKVNFPSGTAPIVAIEADDEGQITFALDEQENLWGWGFQDDAALLGLGSNTSATTPVKVARHVTEIQNGKRAAFIVRDGSYPADSRLWYTTSTGTPRSFVLNLDLASHHSSVTLATISTATETWSISQPETCDLPFDASGLTGIYTPPGGITTVGTGTIAGTQDCDRTYIMGDLTVGTPSEVTFKLSADIGTVGQGEFTISGSGFSVKGAPYLVGTTTTGKQNFQVPVLYDGSALGSVTFGIEGVTSGCTADLSGVDPVSIISPMTVLPIGQFCEPVTAATLSK